MILEGLAGLATMYLLACGLFYLGQWGGGDSKLLMALGAIFGLGFWENSLLGSFLVNLVFFGGVWGGFWSVIMAWNHRSEVASAFFKLFKKHAVVQAKTICYLAAIVVLIAAFALPSIQARLPLIALAVTGLLTFYTWGFAKSIEQICFIKNVPVKDLEEGDWILQNISVRGKRICGPADLGISSSQIKALKKAGISTVKVKEGVPFVPGFFFAYIATIAWGNVFVLIAKGVAGGF